ncbi:hypothetical protein [Paenibacillus dakarensis]|uniref:hypothetical protein n=1 Tax=Paenibacillus dakarensis TaxID=1527293 RepID=UPI0006D5325F|nr:hypothetical protein [Paenibacillus dakarensis]
MKYDDLPLLDHSLMCYEQAADRESYQWKETKKAPGVIWDRFISGTSVLRQPWHNRLQNFRDK